MARLSPEELAKARVEQRKRQEEEERKREENTKQAETKKARLDQLNSVVDALYVEMDKLNRKAPTVTISELSLGKINKMIRSAKELMAEQKDDFIEDIDEFVPAGDMPEYRDVALVLSQVKAGLARFGEFKRAYWRQFGVY